MKILTILGARPQFIKAAVLSREFLLHKEIEEVIVHTGQHFDENMSEVFFQEMSIPKPKYNLDINNMGHGEMTGNMLIGLEKILIAENPDYVLVYGDTNSTLAGALSAKKLNIKVIHVEAGLRSFNMQMPEEINRILTDRISTLLFCPTREAVLNLEKEGFVDFDCEILLSGDVMMDAALFYAGISDKNSAVIETFHLQKNNYLLCTLHRAENTDNPEILKNLIYTLNLLSKEYQIVLPLHPRTKRIIETSGLILDFSPIEPVGYIDMIQLIKNSKMVLTDSGGLQKEAYFFDKFCISLRNQTEWVELVENNLNIIAGSDPEKIIESVNLLENKAYPKKTGLYGNGKSASIICKTILENFLDSSKDKH